MIRRSLWCSIWLSLSLMATVEAQTKPTSLPCSDSSAACLTLLANLAVKNSMEILIVDRALAYQRRKVWTSWLNADGLNPLAVGLRIARNIAGGGDRAAAKLDIAQLERRRAEVEAGLRLAVFQSVMDLEAAGRRLRLARARLEAHQTRLTLLLVGYRLGDGSTEEMVQMWQAGEELRGQVAMVESEIARELLRLQALVHPQ
jgi:hypothetical protein